MGIYIYIYIYIVYKDDFIVGSYNGYEGLIQAINIFNGLKILNKKDELEYKQYLKLKKKYSNYEERI